MAIKQLSDKILKLLYEFFAEHNPKEPFSEEEIFGFLEIDYKDYHIDAALEYLIERGFAKTSLNKHNLPQYKITPEGIDYFESQNQAQKGYCPVFNIQGDMNIEKGSGVIHNHDNHLHYE